MAGYYVNPAEQANGDHEVHRSGCYWLTLIQHPIYLGLYERCEPAVREAKRLYAQVNGCYFCSRSCHTG